MLKKFTKFLKFIVITVIWSAFYIILSSRFMISIWHFDYLSTNNWNVISTFWNTGGSIKGGMDYLFILSLILILPLWYLGLKYFYHINYLNILLFPFVWNNKRMIRKYSENNSRIVLKNIGTSSKKQGSDDVIQERLKLFEKNKQGDNLSSMIRNNLEQKAQQKNNQQ